MINYFHFSIVNNGLIIYVASQQGLEVGAGSVRSAGGSLFTPVSCTLFSLVRRRPLSQLGTQMEIRARSHGYNPPPL